MKVQFVGIVREIKECNTDKEGKPLPPEKVTSQISFLDRATGGDVTMTYPVGHGLATGQDVEIDVEVKPVLRNFKLSLYVIGSTPKPQPRK